MTISRLEIAIDPKGRLYLDALHQASGNDPRHHPQQWVQTDQAQRALARILEQDRHSGVKQAPLTVKRASAMAGGGTYARTDLAREYASWISPAFLQRLDDALERSRLPRPGAMSSGAPELSRLDILKMAMASELEGDQLESEAGVLGEKSGAGAEITATWDLLEIREAAAELRMTTTALRRRLIALRWIPAKSGDGPEEILAYQDRIRAGWLAHRAPLSVDSSGRERVSGRALLTPKGVARLRTLLQADQPKKRSATSNRK